jgi:NAD(P)-dependent dehydrogenase (short-subunit alcohol dehydrogenase family)
VNDLARLEQFFEDLPGPIDHVMVTGPGPHYSSLADMDFAAARRDVGGRIVTTLAVARYGAARMRPPGTLLFIGGTGGRQAGVGLTLISAMTAALPALIASLAVELAPIRANLIAPASSTHPCRRRSSATSSTPAEPSSAPRSPSAVSSDRPMSARWPCTS